MSARRLEMAGAALVVSALAVTLLFTNLGNTYLWQDEAQTAVIARSVLSNGIPLGSDGRNSFSQEAGREIAASGVWKWHTWLSFYLVAASFGVFGETTFAARLPFALCGLACIGLAGLAARRFWRDPLAGLIAAGWLTTCVPFLILARQSRYYLLAALCALASLLAYERLGKGRGAAWLLFAAASGLFHAHHVYAPALFVSLWLHAAACERSKLRALRAPTLGFLAVQLPWILWFAELRPGGDGFLASVLDVRKAFDYTTEYTSLLFENFFPPLLLAIPAWFALDRVRRGESAFSLAPETLRHIALLLLFCASQIATLAVLSPLLYFRYLAPLAAPLAVLAALPLAALLRRSRPLGIAALALWLATSTLPGFIGEIRHDFDGPIEGIVRFLRTHARPDDVVAISYGDMPLKFYTDLRVIGALTGEDPATTSTADWIIIRRHTNTQADAHMKLALERTLATGRYRRHEIDFPDTQFENREEPRQHRFRTARASLARVVIWERER